MRILVVEDYTDTREMLLSFLQDAYEVVAVVDGADALVEVAKAIKTGQFDVLILDIAMQHVDGLSVARAVRCFETHELYPKSVRILYHTGHEDLLHAEQLEKVGVSPEDCFIKPFGTDRLLERLKTLEHAA